MLDLERGGDLVELQLEELFDDLGSEDWRSIIMANISPGGAHDPVLIVEHEGQARGFTGPVSVQESGRPGRKKTDRREIRFGR